MYIGKYFVCVRALDVNRSRHRLALMGQLLSFEDHALARLRARVAAAEEAREDLLAFARGQSGALAAIHQAVLAAMDAADFDHLLHIVVQEWPLILGLDAVALGLIV